MFVSIFMITAQNLLFGNYATW